jgi:hypothetical protein
MVTLNDLQTKTSKEIIVDTGSVDELIDALIAEVISLRLRVEALESN